MKSQHHLVAENGGKTVWFMWCLESKTLIHFEEVQWTSVSKAEKNETSLGGTRWALPLH